MKKLMFVAAVAAGLAAFGDGIESANTVGYTGNTLTKKQYNIFAFPWVNVSGDTWSLNTVLKGENLVAGTGVSNADYIEIWDPSTEGYEQFFYRSSNTTWTKAGTRNSFETVHPSGLPAGTTVWFYSQNESDAPTTTIAGEVLATDDATWQLTLNQYNMLGAAFPIQLKLNDATQVTWGDAVGGTGVSNADYIEIWDPTTEGYEQFFYRSSNSTWTKAGTRNAFEVLHPEGMDINGGFWYFAQARGAGAEDEVTFLNPTKSNTNSNE